MDGRCNDYSKDTRLKLAIVTCLVAFITVGPYTAAACDMESAGTLMKRCVVANDTGDNEAKAVYCSRAAEEFGLCALDHAGTLHYDLVAFEARALSVAGAANIEGGLNPTKGRVQIRSAKRLATSVLMSKTAPSRALTLARNILDDLSKVHL